MEPLVYSSLAATWLCVIVAAFLVLGLARQVGTLAARLDAVVSQSAIQSSGQGLTTGMRAPPFELYDTTGALVRLQDYQGSSLLLVFAGSGCGACDALLPAINQLVTGPHNDFDVLVILNSDRDTAARWRAVRQLAARVATQQNLSVSQDYQATTTPYGFIINAHGSVVASALIHGPEQFDEFLSPFNNQRPFATESRQPQIYPSSQSSEGMEVSRWKIVNG